MKRLITTAMLAMMMTVSSQAAQVVFDLTGLFNIGPTLTFSGSDSEFGVNFTSDVELSALAGSILVDANGTGVTTPTAGTTFGINAGEGINFAAPTITSVSGGSVVFTGYESITFSEFDTDTLSSDTGDLNGALVNSDGLFQLLPNLGVNPTTLSLEGVTDALPSGNNGFQVTEVVANFTVIPTTTGVSGVPEPSSFAALLLIGGCAVSRRRRRK